RMQIEESGDDVLVVIELERLEHCSVRRRSPVEREDDGIADQDALIANEAVALTREAPPAGDERVAVRTRRPVRAEPAAAGESEREDQRGREKERCRSSGLPPIRHVCLRWLWSGRPAAAGRPLRPAFSYRFGFVSRS